MVDAHSHILPRFDDGAKDLDTSLAMLKESYKQGIGTVISTSHCYPKCEEDIAEFVGRRERRLRELEQAYAQNGGEGLPKIVAGCELNLMTDVSRFSNLDKLCVAGTNYILLEMPYTKWNETLFDIIYKVKISGLEPVMAHIDRFLYQDRAMLNALFELDVYYQVNAEAFLDKKSRRQVAELMENGTIHVLGSDMHNMSSRPPQLGKAMEICGAEFGGALDCFKDNGRRLAAGESLGEVRGRLGKRRGLFAKLFGK